MRLKIFTADTMKEALAEVRESLGDDAIIINSLEENGKVTVTAAMEIAPTLKTTKPKKAPKPKKATVQRSLKELQHEDFADSKDLSYFLAHHGIEQHLMHRILKTAASFEEDGNVNALARALDLMFHFSPLNNDFQQRPIMLVGPPGVGKTVTSAKLTSQAVLSGRIVRLINTDTIRTGGTAQLEGYAAALKIAVIEAAEPCMLLPAIETNKKPDELVIIDTMGYNPFDSDEMAQLHKFITAYDVEPILVMAAGMDIMEAREIAETYMNLGVKRFIATRLDVARRYAGLLSAAASMDLAFAGVGITPYLANGIERINALSLAKLLTRIHDRKIFIPPSTDKDTQNEDEDDVLIIDDEESKL
ncbi:MAG: ATP-binding protein [Emcibacter sp.]|nr:ATP-binding protein [Emcibacter sp.]